MQSTDEFTFNIFFLTLAQCERLYDCYTPLFLACFWCNGLFVPALINFMLSLLFISRINKTIYIMQSLILAQKYFLHPTHKIMLAFKQTKNTLHYLYKILEIHLLYT